VASRSQTETGTTRMLAHPINDVAKSLVLKIVSQKDFVSCTRI